MPWRPAEYSTVSAGIFLPLLSSAIAPWGWASTEATVSPKRNVTARSRRWYLSASTTSSSQNSSILIRRSTTVTLVPSAANMEAYSMPITPAPATTIERGTCSRWMMPSESMMVFSSKATLAGRAGLVPDGDDDVVRADLPGPAAAVVDLDLVRPGEPGGAGDDRDAVAGQLAAHHVTFLGDHARGSGGQVRDRDLVLDPVGLPVDLALVDAGEIEDGLAERLGGNRARVQADSAKHVGPFHHGDSPVELRGGDRRPLPARPGTDHQQFIVMHSS